LLRIPVAAHESGPANGPQGRSGAAEEGRDATGGYVGRPRAKPNSFRTPWGDPDLQGVWNDATSTPLQRPTGVASKDILSDAEAEEFQDQLAAT